MALRSERDVMRSSDAETALEDAAKLKQVKSSVEADGLVWADLTDAEKKLIYKDYTGEELRNIAEVERAEALIDMEMPQGRQMGDIYQAANPLEFVGKLANSYVGNKKRRAATDKQETLSKQKAQALELAGGLGAGNVMQQRAHELELAKARNPMPPAPPTPGGPQGGGPPPGAQPPAPPPDQQPQMPSPGQSPGQNVNAAMSMNMQGTPQILGPAPPGGYKSQMPPQGQAQISETEFMKRFKLEEMMRLMRGQ